MLRVLICLLALTLPACVKVEPPKEDKVEVKYDYNKEDAEKLVSAFDDLNQEECRTVYTLFRGTAAYLERVEVGPVMTSDALSQFGKVRDSYKWRAESHKDLTDAVEKYLKDKGFSDPTWKFEDHDVEMINAFNTLAESAKLAWLSKDESK